MRLFVAFMLALSIAGLADARAQRAVCPTIGPYYWEIGNDSGVLASGSVGSTYNANSSMDIASASKWFYGAYVVERTPALSPTDIKYLTLSSGYDSFKLCTAFQTVASCASAGTNGDYTASADGKFYYGGGHFQQHAKAGPLGGLKSGPLGTAMSAALGVTIAYQSPQLAGGAVLTPSAYGAFLRRLMRSELKLGPLMGSISVCTNPTTCPTALNTPIPGSESWLYSLGHWVEEGDGAFSSPGAFGFYPWISADRKLYGIVARKATGGAWSSVQCGRELRKAWIAAHPS